MATQYNLGLLSGRLNRLDRAEQLFAGATAAGEQLLGPRHPTLLPLLEGQAKLAVAVGRQGRARALCARAREIHAGLPAPSPVLLLPIAVQEAQIAAERREPTALALAAEAEALAAAGDDAGGLTRAFVLLRSQVYQDGREAEYAAALERIRGLGPEMWGETLFYRVNALLGADRPSQVLAVLEAARSTGPWTP